MHSKGFKRNLVLRSLEKSGQTRNLQKIQKLREKVRTLRAF
jgi:hypothetical protein